MTKLKSPSSNGAPDTELIATIEEQSAELRLLRKEVAEWRRVREGRAARHRVHQLGEGGRAALHRARRRRDESPKRSACPARIRSRAAFTRRGTAASCGRCASSRASAARRDTNERFKFLLEHGQTGLSIAFDFPTLMGYDSDHPRSEGEVGKCGVAISSLADMETLFDGIPLDEVSTSMTINGPAIILCCFYIAAAEKQGVDSKKLRGTIQNDILKEYMAQHAWVYPDRARAAPHRRLLRVGAPSTCRSGTRSRSPATTSAKPARRRRRSSRSRSPTASPTSSAASRAGSTSTTSRRGSRSSGTSTTTSSRRSPSSAPRAASGRAT